MTVSRDILIAPLDLFIQIAAWPLFTLIIIVAALLGLLPLLLFAPGIYQAVNLTTPGLKQEEDIWGIK